MAFYSQAGQLRPFGPAVCQEATQVAVESYPPDYHKSSLLELSTYLLSVTEASNIFNQSAHDPFTVSLKTISNRLQNGYLMPSPLQGEAGKHIDIKEQLPRRTGKTATNRPLEDFEDLYYAVLGHMQDIHHTLQARLFSGFSTLEDHVAAGGPTISELNDTLAQYWDVLNDPSYVKTLDNAVRRSRIKHLHQEILTKVQIGVLTQKDADELLADLYDPHEYDGIAGLSWIVGWSPAMIGAWLKEKYRLLLQTEKHEETKKASLERRKARMNRKASAAVDKKHAESETLSSIEPPQQRNETLLEAPQPKQVSKDQNQIGNHALDWQTKTERVQQYSQYLRGMASEDAMWLVQNSIDGNGDWES